MSFILNYILKLYLNAAIKVHFPKVINYETREAAETAQLGKSSPARRPNFDLQNPRKKLRCGQLACCCDPSTEGFLALLARRSGLIGELQALLKMMDPALKNIYLHKIQTYRNKTDSSGAVSSLRGPGEVRGGMVPVPSFLMNKTSYTRYSKVMKEEDGGSFSMKIQQNKARDSPRQSTLGRHGAVGCPHMVCSEQRAKHGHRS